MAYAGRMFRVFVSSTFSDLQVERDALQKEVFPKLRTLCRQQGARFQAVDLRWGVSEEASLDQQAAWICLNEIERCQQVSPRPNFLVLLGDRYGSWLPPTRIPASEFETLYGLVTTDGQQRLDEWYRQDANAVPVEYCLLPRTGAYRDDNTWADAVRALHATFLAGIEHLPSGSHNPVPYLASITEQEIRAGVLDLPGTSNQACCFFRRISNLEEVVRAAPSSPAARSYVDLDQSGTFDAAAHRRLEDLKARLQARVPHAIYNYETQWTGSSLTQDYLTQFCNDVYTQLKRMIEEELAKEQAVVQNDHEIVAHRAFAEERRRHFTGRADILETIESYLTGTERSPLIVHGDSGVGKSTLMAQAIQQAQRKHPTTSVVARFVGVTPASMDERALLQNLCHQISQMYDADETTIPTTLEGLVQEFPKRLALATESAPLVLFLDALDQLGRDLPDQDFFSLKWLPTELPLQVRLVVSTTSDSSVMQLFQRLPARSLVKLEPMSPSEGQALLDLWLADAQRTLQESQRQEVLGKFAGNGLPLYLKLAFEEACRWKSYTPFGETQLASDIPGLLNQLFDRLSLPTNYGTVLVKQSLGYLGAAKEGLSEDEMLDLLSLDHQVLEDVRLHSPRSPKVDRLPIVIWSRLFFDLEPYLTERVADGTTLMTFYHRQLASAVADRYLSGEVGRERHRGLADYFLHSDVKPIAGGAPTPNLRKLAELPYQQTLGELWSELSTTLTDVQFLARKIVVQGMAALEADVSFAWNKVALWQESHEPVPVAANWPELLLRLGQMSHLVYRVQTESEIGGLLLAHLGHSLLSSQPAQANILFAPPFLTAWHRLPDKSSSALYRTLTGHTNAVSFCSFSPDSRFIVSSSADKTLKIWDITSGTARLSLPLQSEKVKVCAISPDSRMVASVSDDQTLKIWDIASGRERLTLVGHTGKIRACAFSPDGQLLVSAAEDQMLKVWDVLDGSLRLSLTGHTEAIISCAFSPDGQVILSTADDWTLKVWDTQTGQLLSSFGTTRAARAFNQDGSSIVTIYEEKGRSNRREPVLKVWDVQSGKERFSFPLLGQMKAETACAFSPDGRWIVFATDDKDKTIKILDALSGAERFTLKGHAETVTACAFSPDGRWIVSSSADQTLKVWDATCGLERFMVEHTPRSAHTAIAPNRRWRAHGIGTTITLKGMTLSNYTEHYSLSGHSARVNSCAFSPDGNSLISASNDGVLKVWDIEARSERFSLVGHTKSILTWTSSFDGRWLVSASEDLTLRVWDLSTGTVRSTFIGHTAKITTCSFSFDGNFVVSADADCFLKVWDTISGMEQYSHFTDYAKEITACALSFDGRRVVCAFEDSMLQIWENTSGAKSRSFRGDPLSKTTACAFSPDGRRVISTSKDKKGKQTYKVWNVVSGNVWNSKDEVYTAPLTAWAMDAHGRTLISADGDGKLQLWDINSGQKGRTLINGDEAEKMMEYGVFYQGNYPLAGWKDLLEMIRAWKLAVSDTPFALADLKDLALIIRDTATGKISSDEEWDHTMLITASACSPDGRSFVTASDDGTLKIWGTASGKERVSYDGHTSPVTACAFNSDGHLIVTAPYDDSLKVWEASSGMERLSFPGHMDRLEFEGEIIFDATSRVTACAFSPDGHYIVTAAEDMTLKVWDASSGVERFTLQGHTAAVKNCAVSANNRLIVSASSDHTLKVWNLHTGECLLTFPVDGKLLGCAFHPDGEHIIACDDQGVHFLWLVV